MTVPSHLRIRAAAVAEQFRHLGIANPSLDMVGIHGRKPEGIAVMRLDDLLGFLGAVTQGVVPENDTHPAKLPHAEFVERILGHGQERQPGDAMPIRTPVTFGDLAAETLFEEALTAYDDARAAERQDPTAERRLAARYARTAMLAAYRDALPADYSGSAIPTREPTTFADLASAQPASLVGRLRRTFSTMVDDDTSEVGTEARARLLERTLVLLDAIAEVERLERATPS